jgi:hypothetical protein
MPIKKTAPALPKYKTSGMPKIKIVRAPKQK